MWNPPRPTLSAAGGQGARTSRDMLFFLERTKLRCRSLAIAVFVAASIASAGLSASGAGSADRPPAIKGQSAVLLDAETGQTLWSLNANVRRPMASTTKVMTVVLALERGNLDDVVTAPKGIDQIPASSLHIKPGEKLTLRELVYAAIIRSANDASALIGTHIAGSTPEFVKMMNERAADLGVKDTQFKNANGLNAQGHYSTAHDLAILTRHALTVPLFNEICATKVMTLESRKTGDRLLKSRARFLMHYPGADGVKSGYTRQAGYCYIGSATSGGWRLVSVVLKSSNAGADTKAMMDHGFGQFERRVVAKAGTRQAEVEVPGGRPRRVGLILRDDLHVCVKKGAKPEPPEVAAGELEPPIAKGAEVGRLVAKAGGRPFGQASLVAEEEVKKGVCEPLAVLLVIVGGPPAFQAFRVLTGGPRPYGAKRHPAAAPAAHRASQAR